MVIVSTALCILPAIKVAKYEIQESSTGRATLFRCKFCVDVSRFSPCVINLSRNKNFCCGLKKVVAKRRARVYFEQQILALLLVFIKLITCHATNLFMLRDKLKVFVLYLVFRRFEL